MGFLCLQAEEDVNVAEVLRVCMDWNDARTVKVKEVGEHEYIAARGGIVYEESYPGDAIDVAWYGEIEEYHNARETSRDVNDISGWIALEITGDGGVWYARGKRNHGDGSMGDSPGEAAVHFLLN